MARNLAQSELAYLPCPLYGFLYSFERLCVPVLVLACTPGRETLRSMRTGCACALGLLTAPCVWISFRPLRSPDYLQRFYFIHPPIIRTQLYRTFNNYLCAVDAESLGVAVAFDSANRRSFKGLA